MFVENSLAKSVSVIQCLQSYTVHFPSSKQKKYNTASAITQVETVHSIWKLLWNEKSFMLNTDSNWLNVLPNFEYSMGISEQRPLKAALFTLVDFLLLLY